MRILHLIPNFTGGGAERQLALLAPELCRLGADIHIAFCKAGINSENNLRLLSNSDVKLHCIASRTTYDPRILLQIFGVIRAINPHLIQTWLLQMDVLGGLGAMAAGVPFIVSERSSALMYPRNWKYRLRSHVGRRATAIIANSKGGAEYWEPWASRIAVIPNGLPLDLLENAPPTNPTDLDFQSDARLILCASRFSSEKNMDLLITALDQVLLEKRDCVAVLFGDGELRPSLEARVAKLHARDRLHLPGYTDKLWSWMRRASVFVSVSRFEGNPNAVLEAMAIGCPLVVSNIPQHREILNEPSAIWCDPNSVEDITNAIGKALANKCAAATRAKLARQRTKEWSLETAARSYMSFYNSVVRTTSSTCITKR